MTSGDRTTVDRLAWEIAVIDGTLGRHGLAVLVGNAGWRRVVEETA